MDEQASSYVAADDELPSDDFKVDISTKVFAALAAVMKAFADEGSDGIESSGVEDAVTQMLGMSLPDVILDLVLDKTEGKPRVSKQEFSSICKEILLDHTQWGTLSTKPQAPVGIDSLPAQMQRKLMKDGTALNLMVVGRAGLGKSTFLDTFFRASVNPRDNGASPFHAKKSTTDIRTIMHVVEEGGLRLHVTLTDTPGFGDSINNSGCWDTITRFIESKHSTHLDNELAVDRNPRALDGRVHAVLYFIEPTGHSLSPLDIVAMQDIQKRANLVPVIAKADTFTSAELRAFKERLRAAMRAHNIRPYPQRRSTDSADESAENEQLLAAQPFGVVGSNAVTSAGKWARRTRAGVIEIDNPAHCDFSLLQDMLMRQRLYDLCERTNEVHYEEYRRKNLIPPSSEDGDMDLEENFEGISEGVERLSMRGSRAQSSHTITANSTLTAATGNVSNSSADGPDEHAANYPVDEDTSGALGQSTQSSSGRRSSGRKGAYSAV